MDRVARKNLPSVEKMLLSHYDAGGAWISSVPTICDVIFDPRGNYTVQLGLCSHRYAAINFPMDRVAKKNPPSVDKMLLSHYDAGGACIP